MGSGIQKRIGFIGLGQMGKWMAINLLKGDFDLTVFDLSEKAMTFLAEKGAKRAQSPADIAKKTDIIFLSLPNSNVAENVVFGEEGIIHGVKNNQSLIDLGTSNYMWTKDFSARLKEKNIRFFDAPVTGMEDRAKDGSLTIMFGGAGEMLEEISPALYAMGSMIIHMGEVGSGQLSKMINNVLLNVNLAVLAEVLPMAADLGLDPEKITQVVNSGSGQSFASKVFLPKILDNCFDHGYPMNHAYKDMENVCEISSYKKIPIPVVRAALSTYQTALKAGYGEEDKGAMIKIFEYLLNVEFRKKN